MQATSRALELIGSAPDPQEHLDLRLEALLLLAQSCETMGDLGRAEGTRRSARGGAQARP